MRKLPLCVRVSPMDLKSSVCLTEDGWRKVGTMVTYRGLFFNRCPVEGVRSVKFKDIKHIVRAVKWTGRLWRDPEFPDKDAMKWTKKGLKGADAIYEIDDGFCAMSGDAVFLIGVLPGVRKRGVAKKLLTHAFRNGGGFQAGTYRDNEVACKLYERMGMRRIATEDLWHK